MTRDGRGDRRGIGALLRDLADGGARLIREEVRLAQLEIHDIVVDLGTGTALVAMGVVFAMLGGLALIIGLALLIGDQWLPRDLYWVAALALMVLTGAVTAYFARRGMGILALSRVTPRQTVTTLKEDSEWLKQRLTSGATSS